MEYRNKIINGEYLTDLCYKEGDLWVWKPSTLQAYDYKPPVIINSAFWPYIAAGHKEGKAFHQIIYGGSGCFVGTQLVLTISGPMPIQDIEPGALVLSYNHETRQSEYRQVIQTHCYKEHDRLIRIRMKDGTVIEVTENHEFYFGGAYLKIKDILSKL